MSREVTFVINLTTKEAQRQAGQLEGDLKGVDQQGQQLTGTMTETEGSMRKSGTASVFMGQMAAQAFTKILSGARDAATAVFRAAGEVGEYATKIDTMSQRTGLATDFLQEMEFVAGQVGIEFSSIERVADSLTRRLDQMQDPTSTQGEYMAQLGVSVHDASGEMRSMEDLMPDILQSLSGMENETERNMIGMQLLGRGFTDMIPLLNESDTAIDELTQQFHDMGGVIDEEGINTAREYDDSLDALQTSVTALARNVGVRAAEAFIPYVENISRVTDAISRWVQIPTSERLKDERMELHVLSQTALDSNTQQERRLEIIRDLQSEYPGFLENMDAEAVSNEDIKDAVHDLNEEYLRKIRIQVQEEEIEEASRRRRTALEDQMRAERDLRRQLNDLNERYSMGLDLTNMDLDEAVEATQRFVSENRSTAFVMGMAGDQLTGYGSKLQEYETAVAIAERREREFQETMEDVNRERERHGDSVSENEEAIENEGKALGRQVGHLAQVEEQIKKTNQEHDTLSGRLKELKDIRDGMMDQAEPLTEQQVEALIRLQTEIEGNEQLIEQNEMLFEQKMREMEVMQQINAIRETGIERIRIEGDVAEDTGEQMSERWGKEVSGMMEGVESGGTYSGAMERAQKTAQEQLAQTDKRQEENVRSLQRLTTQAIMHADSVSDAASNVINALIAEAIAYIARDLASTLGPFAAIAVPAAAAAFSNVVGRALPGFATGGWIDGPGSERSDDIPIMASRNEFMMNAQSAQSAPRTIERMNDDPDYAASLERQVNISHQASQEPSDINPVINVTPGQQHVSVSGAIYRDQIKLVTDREQKVDDKSRYAIIDNEV